MYTKAIATMLALSALVACRSSDPKASQLPVGPQVGSTDIMIATMPAGPAVHGSVDDGQSSSESDRKITAEIRKVVVADRALSPTAKNVTILTQDKKVTLRGPVEDLHEKAKLEVYALDTDGVKLVEDQLEVK